MCVLFEENLKKYFDKSKLLVYNNFMKIFKEVGFASEQEKSMASANDVKDEKKEEKVSEQVKPYPVFGSDFQVSQPDFIIYYKYRMRMMKLKYKLVGRVDENGQYVIDKLIMKDLIKMEKEIEDQGENFYKAIALYMKKHFYYTVKIQKKEDGKAVASLYLAEYVDNFLGHEYIVSHIANFSDVYDQDFRVKVRKAFNLVDVNVKVDDFAVPDLAVIMQDAFDFELIAGGLYDSASQIFVMSMLKELEGAGDIGKELLAKYRMLLSQSDIEINEKFRYISYKALLDRLIDEYGGYEKIGLDPKKVQQIVLEMNKTLMQIDKASARGPMEMEVHNKSDKQKVLSAGKKNASKKASGKKSDSSNAEKKKDAKKDKIEAKGPGVTLDSSPQTSTAGSSGGVVEFLKDMADIALGAATIALGGGSILSDLKDIFSSGLGSQKLTGETDSGKGNDVKEPEINEFDIDYSVQPSSAREAEIEVETNGPQVTAGSMDAENVASSLGPEITL